MDMAAVNMAAVDMAAVNMAAVDMAAVDLAAVDLAAVKVADEDTAAGTAFPLYRPNLATPPRGRTSSPQRVPALPSQE